MTAIPFQECFLVRRRCSCGYFPTALGRVCNVVPKIRHAARDEIRNGAENIKIMASGGAALPSVPVDNTN